MVALLKQVPVPLIHDKKSDIKWNFTKFLISRDGRVLKRYEPTDKLSDIEADISSFLKY